MIVGGKKKKISMWFHSPLTANQNNHNKNQNQALSLTPTPGAPDHWGVGWGGGGGFWVTRVLPRLPVGLMLAASG